MRRPVRFPFDAVFYINLDHRQDRLAHMASVLRSSRLDTLPPSVLQRVPGIDGTRLNMDDLCAQGMVSPMARDRFLNVPLPEKHYGMDLTPGALGCAMSHMEVWRRIAHSTPRLKCALILEDDVELSPRFPYEIEKRMATAPNDWQLLYLGGVDLLSAGKPARPLVEGCAGWRRAYSGQRELTAYCLHSDSAARCLELCKTLDWQIDTHLCMKTVLDDVVAKDSYIVDPMSYALHPTLAIQLSKFGTNVQKTSELESGDAYMVDAKRRAREFLGGLTSVR